MKKKQRTVAITVTANELILKKKKSAKMLECVKKTTYSKGILIPLF